MKEAIKSSLFIGFISVISIGIYPDLVKAQQWFQCPNGWTLQTQSGRARCLKEAQRVRVQPDAGCPIGTVFSQDYRGNTDYCLPATGTVLGRPIVAACASGQEKEVRAGRDRCYQVTPASSRAVDVPVN